MALETESSRLPRSPARAVSAEAVKKLIGLSRAELTFLPVARRPCVRACRSAVCCRTRRFDRIAAERVMSDIVATFLVQIKQPIASDRARHHGCPMVTAAEKTWLICGKVNAAFINNGPCQQPRHAHQQRCAIRRHPTPADVNLSLGNPVDRPARRSMSRRTGCRSRRGGATQHGLEGAEYLAHLRRLVGEQLGRIHGVDDHAVAGLENK